MKYKILVNYWIPDVCVEKYKDEFEFIAPPTGKRYTQEELKEKITDCDAFFVIQERIGADIINAGRKLKVIAHHAVGYDAIDLESCNKNGVALVLCPTKVTETTAELAVALIMSAMRSTARYDREIRKGVWTCGPWVDRDMQLIGHSLGVVGFGRIGRSVARKAAGLGMKIFYYDPYRADEATEKEYGAVYMPLNELISRCDCITLHLPYTKANHHLIDDNAFASMKDGVYLVNAARGPIVDEQALIRALKSGKLGGAGLDVYEFEPKIAPELLEIENVVLTPHAGSQTLETRVNMWHEGMQGVIDVLEGRVPATIVNAQVLK